MFPAIRPLFRPRLEALERRDCPTASLGIACDELTSDVPTPVIDSPIRYWVIGTELPSAPERRNLVTLHSMDLDLAAELALGNQVWDFKTEQGRQITFIQDV